VNGGLVTNDEVARELAGHPGWRRAGRSLVRTTRMRDFQDALAFVERIGATAMDYVRRQDTCTTENNRVQLTIANPHHAGLTLAELRLARKVDAILDAHHPDATSV